MLSNIFKAKAKKNLSLLTRCFSHGPYNPMHYKHMAVSETMPETEDFYTVLKSAHENPVPPVYNMRHLHPIRQSGPIPPYDGSYTMEDIRKMYSQMKMPWDHCPQSTDVEEIMRRVPGLTRKEALKIQQMGFTPEEEVDFAYIVVNNGIDVFYEGNQAYFAR